MSEQSVAMNAQNFTVIMCFIYNVTLADASRPCC